MKKTRPFNYILRVVLFLFLAVLGFHYVNRVLTAKDPEELSPYYYDYPKGSFDVIIAGPSVMKNAVQPVQLWQDYGIRAYNLSCGNQSLSCSYYILKDAIDRDHPSLVILDVTYAEEIYITRSKNFVHYLTDIMPLTDTYRYEMIQDVVQPEDRIEFYFPFYSFHSRWKEISASDFKNGNYQKYTLGSVTYAKTVGYDAVPFQRYDVDTSLSDISREYLDKIIALCNETGTQLLFTCCPVSSANGDCDERSFNSRRAVMKDVSVLAAENNVPFLNFLENPDAVQMDAYKDFWDGIHLNMFGSAKLTDFLGAYISNNYTLPEHDDSDSFAKRMDELSEHYEAACRSQAFTTVSRADVLMELLETYRKDSDLVYVIEASGADSSQLSSEIVSGFRKLGLTLSAPSASAQDSDTSFNYLAVTDAGIVVQQEAADNDTSVSFQDTVSGCRIRLRSAGVSDTYEDISEQIILQDGDYTGDAAGLHIAVYDSDDHKLIDCITLSFDGTSLTHWTEAGN